MEYEITNFCEFDKYASVAYCGIHKERMCKNLGDITKVKKADVKPFNVLVGGSPCQDFSVAGLNKGCEWICRDCGCEYNPITVKYNKRKYCPNCSGDDIDKTRSSLLIYYLQFVRNFKPNFGVYENVPGIMSKRNIDTFNIFIDELKSYGYNVYYKVLNGKDYGIPQNRERVFVLYIKKDLDNGKFRFPKEKPLKIKLNDLTDEDVNEKYYLSKEAMSKFVPFGKIKGVTNIVGCAKVTKTGKMHKSDMVHLNSDFSDTLGAKDYKGAYKIMEQNEDNFKAIGFLKKSEDGIKHQSNLVYSDNNIVRTLNAVDHKSPVKITQNGDKEFPFRIRNLTPNEYFRLMGFSDADYAIARKMLIKYCYNGKDKTQSQMYKMAGNSIIVNCPYYILVELYKVMPYLFKDVKICSLFSGIGAFEKAFKLFYDKINGNNLNCNKKKVQIT
jgi:DNA (cytosine-5)-methyltransferase 1